MLDYGSHWMGLVFGSAPNCDCFESVGRMDGCHSTVHLGHVCAGKFSVPFYFHSDFDFIFCGFSFYLVFGAVEYFLQ